MEVAYNFLLENRTLVMSAIGKISVKQGKRKGAIPNQQESPFLFMPFPKSDY